MRRFDSPGREVHLWAVRLSAQEQGLARALSWLSPDEAARAERFRLDKHRRAFALGRAALRKLVSGYLGLVPTEVSFVYGPKGKPALAGPAQSLRFNASNSGDLAVYAFAEGCELGVDVEHRRPVPEIGRIADRFFAREEAAELMALPEAERTQGFFNCWTRKEAYIKAVGGGLSVPLDSFRVTLGSGAQLLCVAGSAEAARGWTMHGFRPAPGYTGALAYPDQPRRLVAKPLLTASDLMERWVWDNKE
jgi:4'-phosphopantetheinyl transferase